VISRLCACRAQNQRCSWILKNEKEKRKKKKGRKKQKNKKRRPVEHRTSGAAGKCTF
jgi:hypothetical protein